MINIGYLIKIITLGIYLGTGMLALEIVPAAQRPPGEWETIIENRVFTETLYLNEGDDNTLILNATFHDIKGSALMIRDVSNVMVKNCTIYNTGENGIVLRSTGSTRNVTIDGCKIYDIKNNGIIAKQNEEEDIDHTNLVIKNNTLYNIGTTTYDHGIYVFSTDTLIENNTVYGTAGNGISIRTSGIVRGNKVWDTQESCIKYYSNHAPGASNALYIENNVCYQTKAGSGDPGISLRRGDEAPETWLVQDYYIRFNTVVLDTDKRYGFEITSPDFESKHVELYGNLFINTQSISKTLHPQYVDYLSSNYTSTSLAGFVNSGKNSYDFQLTADSPARYYASTEHRFPMTDIDGATRATGYLDAGAYQSSKPPATEPLMAAQTQPSDQHAEGLPEPLPEGQDKPSLEAANSPSENSATTATESQDQRSEEDSDILSIVQESELDENFLLFIVPLGLLILGVIVIFRTKSRR